MKKILLFAFLTVSIILSPATIMAEANLELEKVVSQATLDAIKAVLGSQSSNYTLTIKNISVGEAQNTAVLRVMFTKSAKVKKVGLLTIEVTLDGDKWVLSEDSVQAILKFVSNKKQTENFDGLAIEPETTSSLVKATTATTTAGTATEIAAVIDLVNKERTTRGLVALVRDSRLRTAAQGHAADMATKNYFSHTSLDGRSPFVRIAAAGYPSNSMRGENIAAGYSTPSAVMTGWMNSTGHRANILNTSYRAIGVGKASNTASTYKHYWVQTFGSIVGDGK